LEQIIEEEQHGGPALSGLNYSGNHKLIEMKIFRGSNHARGADTRLGSDALAGTHIRKIEGKSIYGIPL